MTEAIESALVNQPREVHVLLTDDHEITALNRAFRGQPEPTDVLTFPAPDFPGAPLGEIAISVPTAARQAALRGGKLSDELVVLALHGALHLAGFDDETPEARRLMLARQNEIAARLGLPTNAEWTSLHYEGVPR